MLKKMMIINVILKNTASWFHDTIILNAYF